MIGHTGLLEYHPCPLGALCRRVYCPFMHEQAPQKFHLSQSPSTSNLVISQEDNNFQGGGYVGYVGTTSDYNGDVMPSTSFNMHSIYAQEPSTSTSSYNQQLNYQQQAAVQYGKWQSTNQCVVYHQQAGQLYGHSTLDQQVNLYAPEDPASLPSAHISAALNNSVYNRAIVSNNSGQRSFSSIHSQPSQSYISSKTFSSKTSNPPKENKDAKKDISKYRCEREQFSPLADAIAINSQKVKSNAVNKKMERANIVKQDVTKSQKRKMAAQVNEYQKNADRHTPDFEKVERAEKQAIEDILSTASHVCSLPLSSEPAPKKKPPVNGQSASAVKKTVNFGKSKPNELTPVKHVNPSKKVLHEQESAKDDYQTQNNKQLVIETKAAPASIQRSKKETYNKISVQKSSAELVSSLKDFTIDLTSDDEIRGNLHTKKKSSDLSVTQLKECKLKVNATKIKGKPDVLNSNIKAITKIDEEIEKIGRDLLFKETKKTTVLKQEKSNAAAKWNKPEPKNIPAPSSGAMHNPHFDINSLFDDEYDVVDASKANNSISRSFQDHPGKISVISTVVSQSFNQVANKSVPKKIPSAAELLRNRFASSASSSNPGTNAGKVYQMFNKGTSRTARQPQTTLRGKTIAPLDPHNKKLSYALRFKYLQKLRDEILNAGGCSEDEAVDKAIMQEKDILDRVCSKIGYGGAVATAIKKIREGIVGSGMHTNEGVPHPAMNIAHHDMLAGRHGNNISMAVKRSKRDDKSHISEADFYMVLRERYIMSKEQLYENGYPIWVDDSTKKLVAIKSSDDGRRQRYIADENLKRICCRCGFEYRLTRDGMYVTTDSECVYHWGKAWKKRINGAVDTRYTCCDQDLSVKGCTYGDHHITDTIRQSTLQQYVETPKPVGAGDPRSNKVYAMDCEMVYGVWGSQIARISVVDVLDELVLDELVRPENLNPVVDCNTRFSGLTKEQLDSAKYNLLGVQERLFELVNSETILIGHSLESDLKSLKIVHSKVVDTSVVFPHRLGPPKKRALKTLTSEFLLKIIQEEESGHDSKEDASVCMKLMLHKIKSDGAP